MSGPPAPIVRLVGVSKRLGGVAVLTRTNLNIDAGRTTALIGPSGSGKTTALRLMMGLILPDEGRVLFEDTPLTTENVRERRARMGYVVQEGGLFPHLTGAENVGLMARHLGWAPARVAARLAELAELVRLPRELLARYPVEISGGQRQRVGLMRALMLDPELLLLDEPLGALDPLVRAELQEDLVRIFAALRKSVVIVTHDLSEAALFAEMVVLLRDGGIVQRGPLSDLVDHPADPFVTRFVNAQRRPAFEAGERLR